MMGDDICVASALTLLWFYNDVDGLHAVVQSCEVLFDMRATVATKAPSKPKPAKRPRPEPVRDDGGGDEEDEEAEEDEEGRVQRLEAEVAAAVDAGVEVDEGTLETLTKLLGEVRRRGGSNVSEAKELAEWVAQVRRDSGEDVCLRQEMAELRKVSSACSSRGPAAEKTLSDRVTTFQ